MARVYVVCEGSTEEAFIKHVLSPFCSEKSVYLSTRIIGKPGHKGGNVNYERVKKDACLLLKQESDTYCTTMLDFFRIDSDFPGMDEYRSRLASGEKIETAEKARIIEESLKNRISDEEDLMKCRPDIRFIPYIQMHEFEGLLFAAPGAVSQALGREDLESQFASILNEFKSPEDIDDGPETAPSKRVLKLFPGYQKILHGGQAANNIGIETMLLSCLHFKAWVDTLLALSETNKEGEK